MSRLFRTNSCSSSSSKTSISRLPEIVNEEHFEYDSSSKEQLDFRDWNIPKVPSQKIYKKHWLPSSFNSTTHVKTVEQVYALSKEHETCQLLNLESIKKHKNDGNNFLHIGLVQVAVKPLTRLGLKASILLCLRDARFTEFSDSTLGVIESSLCNGPVHFDCYPDFTVSLSDPHILKTLTLNIKTEGYNTIKWSEVALPTEWTLVTESQPAPIQRSINNLDYIQQYLDGSVKIRFENQPLNKSSVQLQQLPTPGQSQRHVSARHSFTASSSTLERDLELERDMIDFKLKSLRKSSQVNQPCYGKVPIQDDNTSSPESPTQSDFVVENFATVDKQLRTLNQKFKINWKFLNNHLKATENKPRRDNYHLAYPDSNNRQEIFEEWKDYMRSARVEIFYLDFVESRYMSSKLKTLTKEKWKMVDQTEVESSHPPVETIIISHKGTPFPASPFKVFDNGDPDRKLIEQNNYANQSLIVIGKQLDTIETKIDKISSPETKYWWDKHLTPESKNLIIHAVRLNEDGLPIFDEQIGQGIEDGVNTLFYTIIEHFVGTPSNTTARIHDQLSNLRCPKLSDFRWYKDVFISRVMLRDDSNQPFWKEKFVNGLPNLFAHKIRTTLSNEQGHIDWNSLTYGNIISTINQVGMKMCIDFKIGRQIQSDRKSAKYELGNFCEQYGLTSIPPSRKNKSSYPRHIRKRSHYSRKKHFSRHNNDDYEFYKKKKFAPKKNRFKTSKGQKNSYSKKPRDKSKVKCFKCQKFGHYASECKVKDTIRQLKITDEEKEKLIKVLELRDSELSEVESIVASSESDSDQSSDSQSSSPNIQIGCKDKCCNRLKSISVLTKQEEQEELLIDLISKIENPELKSEYLRKLRKVISHESQGQSTPTPISLNSTLEKFAKRKEVTLQDLHLEVKMIKKEIVEIKQESRKLQVENYAIKQDLVHLMKKDPSESSESKSQSESPHNSDEEPSDSQPVVNLIRQASFRKWYSKVTIFVKNFEFTTVALFDSGADLNCIQEGLIPTKFYQKSRQSLSTASGKSLQLNYEIPKAHVCQNKICFKTSFVLVKNITDEVILDESDRYKTAFVTPFGHYEKQCKPLFDRLQSNPPTWSTIHTDIVKQIKTHVKTLPCLGIPSVDSFKIVETDASDIGYGGILKQRVSPNSPEQIVRFYSGIWTQVFAGCTMAPKKDKQKESAKQPKPSQSLRILPPSMSQNKPELPNQLVPYPSSTPISVAQPIPVANQFSALGSTVGQIRPSYQSTLISSYDPYSASSSVAFKKTSPYLPKSNFHLFVIEPNYNVNSEPVALARHYFPPGFHYMPPSPYKSLKYYRDILLETQSVEIKPIKDRDHPETILYHSLYIHRIISQEAFSSHPYDLKALKSKLQFNYSDYIEAWYSIFLHQSEDFSHSWFINFDNKFKSPFPCWFLHWWEKHGPVDEILPVSVLELIRHFTKKAKFSQVDLFFPKQMLFVARYKVPWILKWSYRVTKDTRIFARQFSVKWWDKFEVDRIAKYVYNDLPSDPIPRPRQRPTSPADSVRSSLSVGGKSKSELQEIARQLTIQASQMDDDEENDIDRDSPSSPSCQPMQQSPAKPKSWYEDSQDPYDAYDLGSD
ncbi:unnamed protein product [Prunus brigantina]